MQSFAKNTCLGLLTLFSFVGTGHAAISVDDIVVFDRSGAYYTGNGGEFRVEVVTSANGNVGFEFYTFCLERTENITADGSTKFKIVDIGSEAITGGGGAVNGADPISNGTAFLFEQFSTGTLSSIELEWNGDSYFYTREGSEGVNDNWAGALQAVIWKLEGEVSADYAEANLGTTQKKYAKALYKYVSDNVLDFDEDYTGSKVSVMNIIYKSNSKNAQSQLYYDPLAEQEPVVPEPMTLAMWSGLSILGLGMARRQRRKVSA